MKRDFLPGNEWLYLKVYVGERTADILLAGLIVTLFESLKRQKLIEGLFFVRYRDPHPHLRLRFLLSNKNYTALCLQKFNDLIGSYYESSLIWKVQIDTYKREIERYGEQRIEVIEKLFCIDTECVLHILQQDSLQDRGENRRWEAAMLLADGLLDVFHCTTVEKQRIIGGMGMRFREEFGFVQARYTRQVNEKYRLMRREIETVFIDEYSYRGLVEQRNAEMEAYEEELSAGLASEPESVRTQLICDLIHMTMNRMFVSENRKNEMILYTFLDKYYQSRIARSN